MLSVCISGGHVCQPSLHFVAFREEDKPKNPMVELFYGRFLAVGVLEGEMRCQIEIDKKQKCEVVRERLGGLIAATVKHIFAPG